MMVLKISLVGLASVRDSMYLAVDQHPKRIYRSKKFEKTFLIWETCPIILMMIQFLMTVNGVQLDCLLILTMSICLQ
jgi:hypothetical protein